MQHGPKHPDWMQWIPCSVIECSGVHAAWLNAENSMQHEEIEPNWMQWIPCSMIECSGFLQHDWMQWIPCSLVKCIPIVCIGFHAPWLNSVYSRQHEVMEHYWMKCILCIMIECSGFLQHEWMQWIFAAWPKASRLNAVDYMQRHWMQKTPCIVAQWIPIVFSGVDAVRPNASRLNAVDFIQHGQKHPDWRQWIPCMVIECSVIHSAW